MFYPVGLQTGPCIQRTRKDLRGHSRLVGGTFNKQGNLRGKMNRSFSPPARTLKSLEVPIGFSHVCSSYSLNSTLLSSRLCPCKQLPIWDYWVEGTLQEQGKTWGVTKCTGPAHGSSSSFVLSVTSSNIPSTKNFTGILCKCRRVRT